MKKFKFIGFSFIIFLLSLSTVKSAVFYTPKEYNAIYNEKVAAELEVKVLKRNLKNEKKKLADKENFYEHIIKGLDDKISNLEKTLEEEKKSSDLKVKSLEKRANILKSKGSQREKELVNEMASLQSKYEEELASLKETLKKERDENVEKLKELRISSDNKISTLSSKIDNLNEELSNLKVLTKNQKRELDRMENQAKELEEKLKKEISEGQIRLKKFHDKLIINIDDKISFDSGSSKLKLQILPALDKINQILSDYPENLIVVEGHTDNIPIKTSQFRNNWQLSTERALSVLGYILKNKKQDPRRFSAAGYGEYSPIVENDTPANRALNRRVDIVIRPRVK